MKQFYKRTVISFLVFVNVVMLSISPAFASPVTPMASSTVLDSTVNFVEGIYSDSLTNLRGLLNNPLKYVVDVIYEAVTGQERTSSADGGSTVARNDISSYLNSNYGYDKVSNKELDTNRLYLTGWHYYPYCKSLSDGQTISDVFILGESATNYVYYAGMVSKASHVYCYCDFTVPYTGTYYLDFNTWTSSANGYRNSNVQYYSSGKSYSGSNDYELSRYAYVFYDQGTINETAVWPADNLNPDSVNYLTVANCSSPTGSGPYYWRDNMNLSLVAGVNYRLVFDTYSKSGSAVFLCRPYIRWSGSDVVLSSLYDTGAMSSESRLGNYSMQYVYTVDNDDNSTTSYLTNNSTSFVDERNMTYYNPVTNTTTDMSGWKYDYSTYTYNVTTTEGDTYTITYGDEYVTVNEGDTIYYYNYYNNPDSTSGDSGNSGGIGNDSSGIDGNSDSAGIWGKLGELFGSIGNGIGAFITGVFGKLLDGLIAALDGIGERIGSVGESIGSIFERIPSLFGDFLALLGAVFAFLPSEMVTLMEFTVLAAAVALIIKILRG